MLAAILARESALRGYGQARRASFLEPYDEASATFAAAADQARVLAKGRLDELAAIAEQQRLAERWAGSANDAIIRLRNRRPVSGESALVRSDLIEQAHAHESGPARPDRPGKRRRRTAPSSSEPCS